MQDYRPEYEVLEKEFAAFIGTKECVVVSSGTGALHLALVTLGIEVGDEVIVPDFSMVAAAFAVTYTGATPVFVDCGKDLNIDPALIEKAITPKTKAIIPVHMYGRPCDMTAIMKIAKKHNLYVIEDACEVHGAVYKGKKLGSWGDIGCFSFFRNKIVHGEEGGALVTNNREWAESARDLKSMAFGKEHNYFHKRIGFNYRMANSQAKLVLHSLKYVDQNLKRRKQLETWFEERFPSWLPKRNVVWVYDFIIREKERAMEQLAKYKPRHFFKPMTSLPMYLDVKMSMENRMAYFYSELGMYVPIDPKMSLREVKDITNVLKNLSLP